MKRRRRRSIFTPRKRQRRPPALKFLGLLPEMHGEIVARLDDVADRFALARTCTAMQGLVKIPKLPPEWHYALECMKRNAKAAQRQSGRHAFVELIAFGLPSWPGVFRHGHSFYRPDEKFGNVLGWQWRDDEQHIYFNISWDVDKMQWEVRTAGQIDAKSQFAGSLAALPQQTITQWRDFLAAPRRRPAYFGNILVWEFDHD